MNIVIAELIRKANEESNNILKRTSEQSIKRRQQLMQYNEVINNETFFSKLLTTIKTHWFC